MKTFNEVSKVIEATYDEDDLEIMNRIAAYTRSVKEQSKKVIKNGTEEPFELLEDSDDDSNIVLTKDPRKVQLLYTYPLSSIFKLYPPGRRAAQQFDDKSFKSNATGGVTAASICLLTSLLSCSTNSSFSTMSIIGTKINQVNLLSDSEEGSDTGVMGNKVNLHSDSNFEGTDTDTDGVNDEDKMSNEFPDDDAKMGTEKTDNAPNKNDSLTSNLSFKGGAGNNAASN